MLDITLGKDWNVLFALDYFIKILIILIPPVILIPL